MKQFVFLCCCLCLLINTLSAQTLSDSISATFPKFLVRNPTGQILLVYDENRQAWEVPGLSYAGPMSFKELVDSAAKEFGVKYSRFSLGGLFTYHYPDRYKTVIRPYFTVIFTGFIDGKGFNKTSRFQWFSPVQIKQVVLYPASVMIVEKIVKEPTVVWAGAFEEYGYTNPMINPSSVKFRVVEPFYKLN